MCRCNFIQKLETCYASIPHKILKTSLGLVMIRLERGASDEEKDIFLVTD